MAGRRIDLLMDAAELDKRRASYGAIFSTLPSANLLRVARTLLFAVFKMVIVSPCLSHFEQGLLGSSFQSMHIELPFGDHLPCYVSPFGLLYSTAPSCAK